MALQRTQEVQEMKKKIQQLYKKYGWKALLGIFLYYLIRDLTIYVIIPYVALVKL